MTRPLPPEQRVRRTKPTPELLDRARELLADGASQTEVSRTTGISKTTLHRKFPGTGWTYREAGAFRQLLKHAKVKDL